MAKRKAMKEGVSPVEDEIEQEEQNEQKMVAQEEYDALVAQLQRLQAEFDNFRKRVEEEKTQLSNFAQGQLLRELLPVLDNFELALAAKGNPEDFRKGIEMIYAQFVDTLEKLGVEIIPTKGESFDPLQHEALMTEEKEGVPSNEITQELQKGYRFKGKVIRCAKVKIAK